ncbi:MAG TPA: cold shock domain-containing protein [Cyclobacteriaceae bacterium]|nr:cold shock domain-containing protein [Cyclobacteriaceae bacterium]HMV08736.1 cold shock domain-containing protein [Cyclobacteriaceae bacterium]HMV90194.1 cold shock domain-containing protein [Cyclobacteriaceae bacterium]HMW99881.1 cold shock domain-containing protein [Cyclobacteriaceae bacterium]HMX49256.1 cold shock domain-containing protein [Cyclobacteriaceae bacterium]
MARPQETFNKKELEKKRAQKKKEKEQRKQDRKANAKSGQSLDDMMAYVDEDGNISSTPPDPLKKRNINVNDIVTGSRNEGGAVVTVRKGKVSFFDTSKGFGFIIDSESGERVFVHVNGLKTVIKENDVVSFETERGPKGLQARDVKVIK